MRLSQGTLDLWLVPEWGGSIARFDWVDQNEKVPIFRGFDGPISDVVQLASFPMVPYCNRIREGTFRFRNRKVTLPRNRANDPSPLHGHGWLNAWEVVSSGANTAELLYVHAPDEWPWAYEARQRFSLDDGGLTLGLDCTNLSDEPMPCGLGQHPFFFCTPDTILDSDVECVWTVDEKVLPVERVPATGRYDMKNRHICGQGLDNGFGGWGGVARIEDPSWPFSIEMRSDDADYFQVYSPPEGGIFVAEPVSHANAALNEPEEAWASLGQRVLEPGETMSVGMRLDVLPRKG